MEKRKKKTATAAEREQRLVEVETLMARRLGVTSIEIHLAKQWGISTRQVRDYVAEVRKRWEVESITDDRKLERASMRASVNDLYARAMAKSEVVKDAAGNPIMGSNGQPLRRDAPDIKAALRAAELLCRLDGLFQDSLKVQAQVQVTGVVGSFNDATKEELAHFAKTGRWPDRDGAETRH